MGKTITTKVTLHVKDEKRSVKFTYDGQGFVTGGRLVSIEVPPGTAVYFEDEEEADKIVDRHGGEETDAKAKITVKAVVEAAGDNDLMSLEEAGGDPNATATKAATKKPAA